MTGMRRCLLTAAVFIAGTLVPAAVAVANVETRYVAQLRAAEAQARAVSAEIAALRGGGGGSVWTLTSVEPNPGGEPPPPLQTVSATNGHMDRTVDADPRVDFDADWDPAPARLAPGATHTFSVAVAARLTGGTNVQGFRQHDAILLVQDRWDGRTGVGAGQSCVDPIGAEPISCTGPTGNTAVFTVSVPATTTGTFSYGVGALNCGACYVRYTYTATSAASARAAAGTNLIAALRSARSVVIAYRDADTRNGTAEEKRLMQSMLSHLAAGSARYGALVGSPIRTTPRNVSLARRLVGSVSREAAAAAVERWPGIEGVAALLKDPRRADRVVAAQIRNRLAAEISRRRAAIATRALRERIPIQLGVPLRTQVRSAAERWALSQLARFVLKLDARGVLLEFLGRQVRIVIADIALAARPTGNVQRRTDITLSGYDRHRERLESLLAGSGDARLGLVRAAVHDAAGAFRAARFLRRDLEDLTRRRCRDLTSTGCTGVQLTRARLAAGDRTLARLIARTEATFLIGQEFHPAELRTWIAGLGRAENDVRRAAAR